MTSSVLLWRRSLPRVVLSDLRTWTDTGTREVMLRVAELSRIRLAARLPKWELNAGSSVTLVITSYSIHYTKLYEHGRGTAGRLRRCRSHRFRRQVFPLRYRRRPGPALPGSQGLKFPEIFRMNLLPARG